MRLLGLLLSGTLLWAQPVTNAAVHSPGSGPARGHLIVIGGGALGADILHRFAALAGGLAAPIVVIPTAGEQVRPLTNHPLLRHGFSNVVQLHTKDRAEADSDAFLAPLRA
ncbi:MAG: peptidase S51, partial [Acidobacteriota bacterium]